MEQYLKDEVQARQQINADLGMNQSVKQKVPRLTIHLALQMSIERGYHWLLHIDIDELFYSFNKSIQQHFK
jgi:hypothetical protein